MKPRQAIRRLRRRLGWTVREIRGGRRGYFEVTSNPRTRVHTITWPAAGDPVRPIEVVHELIHAHLAETVHPQFSGSWFRRGTPDHQVAACVWPCRAAGDWFVDHRLQAMCPAEFAAEVREHAGLVRRALSRTPGGIQLQVSAGLFYAQAEKYLGETEKNIPAAVSAAMRVFLSVPPESPDLPALARLINGLLALRVDFSVRPVLDGGMEVWEIV